MAGGAGAGTSAIGIDAGHLVLHSGFHDGHAGKPVNRLLAAVVLDEGNLGHEESTETRSFCRAGF